MEVYSTNAKLDVIEEHYIKLVMHATLSESAMRQFEDSSEPDVTCTFLSTASMSLYTSTLCTSQRQLKTMEASR